MNAEEWDDDQDEAMPSGSDLLSVPEAAKLLRVSTSTIWRWIDRGILPAYRVGPRRVFVKRSDIKLTTGSGSPRRRADRRERKLTHLEQERWRRAMERARELRERLLVQRGGVPFPPSQDLIHEMRDERSRELM